MNIPKIPIEETEFGFAWEAHEASELCVEMRAEGWRLVDWHVGSDDNILFLRFGRPSDPLCHFLDCANLRVYSQGLYCAEHSARMDAYYEAAKTRTGDPLCEELHREHFPELHADEVEK